MKTHVSSSFLFALFLVFNVGDYFGTQLHVGAGAIEINPIGVYLIAKFGTAKGILIMKIVSVSLGIILMAIYKSQSKLPNNVSKHVASHAYWAMFFAALIMSLVVIYQVWNYCWALM